MALPAGVTTATVTVGVPVTHTGGEVKTYVSIEPSAFLVHAATGTPLVDFLEELAINEGVAGQFTLPHTDQSGFTDESGNSYTNWYYTARITYSTPSKAKNKAPKVKVFQITTGQTDVDLDKLPGGAPALPYIAPTAKVDAFHGRTGAVTLLDADMPPRLTAAGLGAVYAARIDDRDYATLQAAIDATPTGGTLEIRRQWVNAGTVTVARAMRLTASQGGTVTTTGAGVHAITVTSSDVTLDGLTLIGNGSATAGTAAGVRAVGTEAAPIRNLVVRGCTFRDWNKYGIEATSVKDFTISHNLFENIAYGAVMLSAAIKGYVLSNTIKNVVQPAGFVNSYGIAMTRNSSLSLALSPRSSDIVCSGNLIDGVPLWEAIDTHGGENLTITGNRIRNAYIGIALVPSVNESGNDTYAPRNIIVSNNDIDSGKTDGTARSGIQLIGCITTVDNVVEYATGIITDNIVKNGGTENTSAQAAVFLQATRGSIVSKNRIVNASPNGVNLNNNNVNVMVLDNVFVDVWTTSIATTACVYIPGAHQSGTIKGNRAVRADKTATVVHNRGLWISSALTTDIELQYSDNHFKACALPIIDSPSTQNFTEQRMEARKISFYPGITPVARQAVAAAATDAATTQALVNDLRAKLILTGLIS